jgi:hypothetical protein
MYKDDKKKDSLGHQERVNIGKEAYVKTETPKTSLGSQTNINTVVSEQIPMDNKSIERLKNARNTAIGSIASLVAKRGL